MCTQTQSTSQDIMYVYNVDRLTEQFKFIIQYNTNEKSWKQVIFVGLYYIILFILYL